MSSHLDYLRKYGGCLFYLRAVMICFILVATLMHKWLFVYVLYNVILMILCVGSAQYLYKVMIHIRQKFDYGGKVESWMDAAPAKPRPHKRIVFLNHYYHKTTTVSLKMAQMSQQN